MKGANIAPCRPRRRATRAALNHRPKGVWDRPPLCGPLFLRDRPFFCGTGFHLWDRHCLCGTGPSSVGPAFQPVFQSPVSRFQFSSACGTGLPCGPPSLCGTGFRAGLWWGRLQPTGQCRCLQAGVGGTINTPVPLPLPREPASRALFVGRVRRRKPAEAGCKREQTTRGPPFLG